MGPLLAFLTIVVLSLLIVRIGSTALAMTGLGCDAANFQACSAFFGVGFTTREAELVVNHPVRRRIVRDLIIAGNIGLTSALAAVIVTLTQDGSNLPFFTTIAILLTSVLALIVFGKIAFIQRGLDRIIRSSFHRLKILSIQDYDLLLRVRSGFAVSEIKINENHTLLGQELGESRPADRGIIVLSITKANDRFIGAPRRHEVVELGDTLVVYGNRKGLKNLCTAEATSDAEG